MDSNISNATSDSYFQFYSKLLNQQNMLQDYMRTSIYFNAIQGNMYRFSFKIDIKIEMISKIQS